MQNLSSLNSWSAFQSSKHRSWRLVQASC